MGVAPNGRRSIRPTCDGLAAVRPTTVRMTQLPHSLGAPARFVLPMRLDVAGAPPHSGELHVAHFAEAFGGGLLEMVRLVCLGHAEAGIRATVLHGRRPETPLDLEHVPEE